MPTIHRLEQKHRTRIRVPNRQSDLARNEVEGLEFGIGSGEYLCPVLPTVTCHEDGYTVADPPVVDVDEIRDIFVARQQRRTVPTSASIMRHIDVGASCGRDIQAVDG